MLSQKHPTFLFKVHHLQITNYHAEAKALVALIRNNFWIINDREIARRIVNNCIHCVRYRPKLLNQIIESLPAERASVRYLSSISEMCR